MKMWNVRPEAKETPGTHLLMKSSHDINLNRVGDLLNELQVSCLCHLPDSGLTPSGSVFSTKHASVSHPRCDCGSNKIEA
jgi:hypothetical protein